MLLRRRSTALAALLVLSSTLSVATPDAIAPRLVRGADGDGSIGGPAQATAPATRIRVTTIGDLVSVYETNELSAATISAVQEVAAAVGASTTVTGGFSVGLTAVRRNGVDVQRASGPGGGLWQYPMGLSAMPVDAMRVVMGDAVASQVASDAIVMSESMAGLRNARAGDVIDLVAADGSIVSFTIGLVARDADVGGTEIVMSPEQASRLGPLELTRVLVYGAFDRTAIDAAFAARGMYSGDVYGSVRIRIRRSWDPQDPDSQLGSTRTKQLLGDFDFALTSTGGVVVDADWRDARIVGTDFADIHIRTNCNTAIIGDLQAALTEVAQSGLAWAIDLANTNTYGGCYYPRFNRVTGALGFLSRHSWGQPIDMNTVANAQGKVPKMDCRVVRIFRKHGFAWGGNFLTPDGMHFEWVGEPRHQLPYPSKYCPNLPGGAIEAYDPTLVMDGRATFFADDGWDPADG